MNGLEEAWSHYSAGRYFRALRTSEAILQTSPLDVGALCCHALSQWSLGREPGRAISELERARDLAPANDAVRQNLATVLASVGEFSRAAAECRVALQLQPTNGAAFFELCQAERVGLQDPDVVRFERRVEANRLDPAALQLALFGLARVYDAQEEPEKAIKACLRANALEKRPFDLVSARRRLDRLKTLAEEGAFEALPHSQNATQPIFIGGVPRSGTTLVESIIAAHPNMHGAGESGVIGWFEHGLMEQMRRDGRDVTADQAVLDIPPEMLTSGAAAVQRRLSGMGWDGTSRIVEKTPANALSIGLIGAMFPRAKVIIMRRHPLDVGVSNLFTRFQAGQGHAFSMKSVGNYVRLVTQTVSVWKRVAPVPVLEVVYEDLVADPDQQIARILAFCGLEDRPECHKFFESPRAILTASATQVREPITARSVGRWERYLPWLDPMIDAMGGMEWIESYMNPPGPDSTGKGKIR